MSIAQHPESVPYETYVRIERERDQWRTRYQQEQQAHTQTKRLLSQEQQREQQRRQLWKTKLKPAEKATIEAFQRQLDNPNAHRDEQGFTRIVFKTAAINIGMSDKAPKSNFEKVLDQCPDLPKLAGAQIETRREYDAELRRDIPRLYIKAEKSLVAAAITSEISKRIVQGGNQYQCQNENCLSTDVRIERKLICNKCGHTSNLEPTYPNGKLKGVKAATPDRTNLSLPPQNGYSAENESENAEDPQDENFLTPSGQLVGVVIKPLTPPSMDSLAETPADDESETVSQEETEDLTRAAELLLAIAGEDENHIEMSRTGEKKYYDAKPPRPLQFFDLVDHLKGEQAKGSHCSYRDGRTRAQCFDKDEAQSWEELRAAARKLAQANYSPILEESPAERGGHLWILYSDLVDASAARAAVLQIAPELADCIEYWPGPASAEKWNRVRLPGGKYIRRGQYVETPINAWCKMSNVATGESSSDGWSAARLLLSSLTDASLVPPLPPISSEPAPEIVTQDEQEAPACIVVDPAADLHTDCPPAEHLPRTGSTSANGEQEPEAIASAGAAPLKLPKVDARWIQEHGPVEKTTLWFAIIEQYAADWFNERNPLESIRPREPRRRMAFSPNGNERTPSTSYHDTAQGERFTDHSLHGRRADGTRDSGDALELACKVWERSKSAILGETTREIVKQYRAELESAARAGQPIPADIEEVLTPAGYRQYMKCLNAQAQGEIQTVTPAAVTIEQPAPEIVTQDEQEAPACIVVDPAAGRAAPLPNISESDHQAEAREFYDAHCSTPGYTLRIRPNGQIGIGVPEDLSEMEFERIAEQVSMHGEALRQIIQERDPQRPGQGEQNDQGGQIEPREPQPLRSGQRVSTPAGIGTVNTVMYLEGMQRWRCSVWTDASQHVILFASEVVPLEQGRLL